MKWDAAKQEVKDKEHAAYHEAGHCVIAMHFGERWEADITRVGDARLEVKAWIGQMRNCGRPLSKREVKILQSGATLERSSEDMCPTSTPHRTAILGFAGVIAAQLAPSVEVRDRYEIEEFWESCMYSDEIDSATDLEAINGTKQQWRAFKEAWGLVHRYKEHVVRIANQLIRDEFCDSALDELSRQEAA